MLLQLGRAFAELDCLLSLADAAADLRLVRPEIVEDNVTYIKVYFYRFWASRCDAPVQFTLHWVVQNGRHPLQEVIVSAFVPNDAALSPGTAPGAVAVVFGANFSGKSVYIKQVGACSSSCCGHCTTRWVEQCAKLAEINPAVCRPDLLHGPDWQLRARRARDPGPHRPHLLPYVHGGQVIVSLVWFNHVAVEGTTYTRAARYGRKARSPRMCTKSPKCSSTARRTRCFSSTSL